MDDVPKLSKASDSTEKLPRATSSADEPLDFARGSSVPLPSARSTSDAIPPGYVHRFGPKVFYLFARFAAFLVDGCGMTFLLATFALAARNHGSLLSALRGEIGYIATVAGAFAIAVVFAFACEALFGTTIGKLIFALHVRTLAGRHVGAGPVLIRTILYPIDIMLVGLLLAAATRRRQRLGDLLARTVVSNGSIGAFASVIGVAIVIALAYAQAAYAGGVSSVDELASQTRQYTPGIVAHVAAVFGGNKAGVPAVFASGSPTPGTETATAAPVAAPSAKVSMPPAQEASPADASPEP